MARRKTLAQLRQQAARVYSNIDFNRRGAYFRAYRVNRALENSIRQHGLTVG